MDITQYIILIRGQDKTSEVASFTRNYLNNKINIRYHGGFQSYAYNQANVRIFESPQMVDLNNKIAYIGDVPLYNPQCILNFGELIRIIEFNGKSCIVRSDEFYTVENSAGDAAAHQILEYLRDIAQYTTTGTEDSAFLRPGAGPAHIYPPGERVGAVFVGNRASLDFVVFYQQDKSCIFAIEVDGFAFHENQPEQLRRDAMKDNILKKYNLPLLRLATNGSGGSGRRLRKCWINSAMVVQEPLKFRNKRTNKVKTAKEYKN